MRNAHFTMALFFFCAGLGASAQKGTIKGVVKDATDDEELSLASVAVYTAKDTSLITYRLSDEFGEFKITGIPLNTLCRIVITFQGYKVYRKEFELTKEKPTANLGSLYMTELEDEMEEVLVTAERPPMTMRNDTLEFNASAFKTLPAALVEDLLKKLPGVDVDLDGNITVKGKKVNRLLVDGKEFFGGDPLIATRNLPANIVDQIQVVDDKEELRSNPLLTKDEVGQVLNIKLKKSIKQGWFGKAYAGGGTDSRHEAGAIVNLFRDTRQVSVLGYSNNVNKPGFTSSDLQQIGGYESGGRNSSLNYSNGRGIQRSWGSGANFNNQYGKHLKVSLSYFYGQVKSDFEQFASGQRFLKDTVLISASTNQNTYVNRDQQATGSIEWEIDSVTSLSFRPSVRWGANNSEGANRSFSSDNFKGPVNKSDNLISSDGGNHTYGYSLHFSRWWPKKSGRSLNISSVSSDGNNDDDRYNRGLYTFYNAGTGRDSVLNRLQGSGMGNTFLHLDINYTEPLRKSLSLILLSTAQYSKEKNVLDFYDQDFTTGKYTIYKDAFSNGTQRHGWRNTVAANLSYRHRALMITPGITLFWSEFKSLFTKSPDVDQHYFYVFPSLNVSWKGWRLGYNENITEPQAVNLQNVIDISNPLYKRYGNPGLKPAYSRKVNLEYFKFNQKTSSSYNFSINSSFADNTTIWQTVLDSNRVQISRPLNISGTQNYFGYANYSRQYKFSKDLHLSLRSGLNAGFNKNIVDVNGRQSGAGYLWTAFNLSVLLNYKDKIEWNQRYNLNNTSSRYDDKISYRGADLVTHSTESEIIVRWPKHFVWESAVAYNYNPQVGPGIRKSTVRWNGSFYYVFLKEDKGQIKLSAYDLLNQNVNVFRYTGEGYISDVQTTTLRRYFLLSFIYNIRNFGGGRVGGSERRPEF